MIHSFYSFLLLHVPIAFFMAFNTDLLMLLFSYIHIMHLKLAEFLIHLFPMLE